MNNASAKTRKLTTMAMLVAISLVLLGLIHFPIFPTADFLEYDPADIPILVGNFMFGPLSGVLITLLVSVIQAFTVSAKSGIIGGMMHFFATGSCVLAAGFIYKYNRTKKGAAVALVVGSLVMTMTMCLWNLIFTPIFMGAPREAVISMMLPIILPFNLIKAGVNATITFFVYKSAEKLLNRYSPLDK